MSAMTPAGAALTYLRKKFGGNFREQESTPVIGAAAAQIVGNNPDRLAVLIVVLGANSLFAGLLPNVTANSGIQVAPNGGSLSMIVDEDFTFTTRQLFGVAPGGNTQLYVLELIREIALDQSGS